MNDESYKPSELEANRVEARGRLITRYLSFVIGFEIAVLAVLFYAVLKGIALVLA